MTSTSYASPVTPATIRSPDHTLYLVTRHALPVRNGGSRAELFYPLASEETPLLQLASFLQFGAVNTIRAVSGNPGVLDCARQRLRRCRWRLQHPRRRQRRGGGQVFRLDAYLASTKEIIIIGDPQAAATQALLEVVHGHYLPNRVLVVTDPDQAEELSQRIPLLAGRSQIDGAATAYVCENYACQLPITDPAALAKQLG